jgi:RimJ/RimL family protein N-acetyltransferase
MESHSQLLGVSRGANSWRRVEIQDPGRFIVSVLPLSVEHHPDILLYIYNRMRGRGLASFFWDRQKEMPFAHFLRFFSSDEGRALLAIAHHNNIVGAVSLSDFCDSYRAQIGFWLDPRYRGINSHLIGKQGLAYLHGTIGLENLYAMTPWFHAKQYAYRIGMQSVAEIPDYAKWGNRVMDVEVFRSNKSLRRQQHYEELINMGYMEKTAKQAVAEIYDRST